MNIEKIPDSTSITVLLLHCLKQKLDLDYSVLLNVGQERNDKAKYDKELKRNGEMFLLTWM